MKRTADRLNEQVARQVAPVMSTGRAGSGLIATSSNSSSARVVDGAVQRVFLMGDPWTKSYYFLREDGE